MLTCAIKVLQVCVGISCDFQKKEFSVALTYASMTEWLRWRICTMYARVRTPLEADLFLIRIRLNCSTRVSETKASKSIKMGNVKQNQHHTLAVVVCPILLNKARAT